MSDREPRMEDFMARLNIDGRMRPGSSSGLEEMLARGSSMQTYAFLGVFCLTNLSALTS